MDGTEGERVLAGAVGWLDRNLRWFDELEMAKQLPYDGFGSAALLELLVLCRCLNRRDGERERELLGRALDLAEQVVRRDSFLEGMATPDSSLRYRIWLIAALADLGRTVPRLWVLAQSVLDAGFVADDPADGAMRRTELAHLCEVGRLRIPATDLRGLYRSVLLGAGGYEESEHPVMDAYALTHAYFYLTDFGRRGPAGVLGEAERPAAEQRVATLLEKHLGADDMDLTAELLICADVLGLSSRPLVREAWGRLAAAQAADGSLVGGPGSRAVPPSGGADPAAAEAAVFRARYHATLVAAMAAAVGMNQIAD